MSLDNKIHIIVVWIIINKTNEVYTGKCDQFRIYNQSIYIHNVPRQNLKTIQG
jgi:hypothetical protein